MEKIEGKRVKKRDKTKTKEKDLSKQQRDTIDLFAFDRVKKRLLLTL